MVRFAFVGVVLTGCSDPQFHSLAVGFSQEQELAVLIGDPGEEKPCPVIGQLDVTLNDRPGDVIEPGGEDTDPDIFYGCLQAEVRWPPISLSDGPIELEASGDDLVAHAVIEIPDRVWTDDDLVAAYTNGASFTVHWTEPELPRPLILEANELTLVGMGSDEGSATYTFEGTLADPAQIRLFGYIDLERMPFTCTITDCAPFGDLPFDVEMP